MGILCMKHTHIYTFVGNKIMQSKYIVYIIQSKPTTTARICAEAWPCAESLRKATLRLGPFCGNPLWMKHDEHFHFIEIELG